MISVCIATGVSLLREGLLRTLSEERGIVVTATASDSAQVLTSCHHGHPDVLILHTTLPGEHTADLLRRLIQRGCTRNIILFGAWTAETAVAARQLDVCGMIDEREDVEHFVRAVHLVQGGTRYCSEHFDGLLQCEERDTPSSMDWIASVLTPTELQIFRALGGNQTSQEIARTMFISHRTVQKHRSNMARKLKLAGSNALLAFALQHRDD